MRWLQGFLKEYDISAHERTAIELKCLVRAIYMSGVYDQLNSPALASVEELCRRVSQLTEAYAAGSNGRPNFAAVKHFTSSTSVTSVVPSALRSYALRRSKEEMELEHLRLRAAAHTPASAAAHEPSFGLPGPSSSVPGNPKAKVKAKAKPQRQLQAGAGDDA